MTRRSNINGAMVQRKLSGDSLSSSNSGQSQSSTPIHNNWMGEHGAVSSNGQVSNGHNRAPSSASVSTTSSPVPSRRGSYTPSHDTKTRLGLISDSPDSLVISTPTRRIKNHMKSDIFGLQNLTISNGSSPSPTTTPTQNGTNGWINENGSVAGSNGLSVPSTNGNSNGTVSSSASTASSSPHARRRAVFSPDHDTKSRLGFNADSVDAVVISTPRRVKNHMKSDIFGLQSQGGNFKDEWKLNAISPKN